MDPLASQYPHNSPYAFSENRVIDGVELEGAEFKDFLDDFMSKMKTAVLEYITGKTVQLINNLINGSERYAVKKVEEAEQYMFDVTGAKAEDISNVKVQEGFINGSLNGQIGPISGQLKVELAAGNTQRKGTGLFGSDFDIAGRGILTMTGSFSDLSKSIKDPKAILANSGLLIKFEGGMTFSEKPTIKTDRGLVSRGTTAKGSIGLFGNGVTGGLSGSGNAVKLYGGWSTGFKVKAPLAGDVTETVSYTMGATTKDK